MSVLDITKCQVLVTIDEIDNPVPGRSKIVQTANLEGKILEAIVDADLAKFSKFYAQELANNDISNFERAAIKTYLAWKLRVPQRA